MKADCLHIEVGAWSALKSQAAPIREQVFMHEQQVPVELEWDEFDDGARHALAWLEHGAARQAIGTARLTRDGHIGRMAVLAPWRGLGVGSALLDELVRAARHSGLVEVQLNAQCHAEGFYRNAGFEGYGPVFMEAGIAHIAMRRSLK